jgi:hypothetical protein
VPRLPSTSIAMASDASPATAAGTTISSSKRGAYFKYFSLVPSEYVLFGFCRRCCVTSSPSAGGGRGWTDYLTPLSPAIRPSCSQQHHQPAPPYCTTNARVCCVLLKNFRPRQPTPGTSRPPPPPRSTSSCSTSAGWRRGTLICCTFCCSWASCSSAPCPTGSS